jgi:branched-chain amino acid transport system substrate-binding protein
VYVVAEAITRAGTLEKEALITALEATSYVSPVGETLTFAPSNLIEHQGFRKQKILQWQYGQQQVIWPFEYATAVLLYPFELGG